MRLFILFSLMILCLLVCVSNHNTAENSSPNDSPDQKIVKAGILQDVVNFVVDLFDGDGNANGTPNDPYNITLGKNGSHGGSWARDDHPFTIFNRHINTGWLVSTKG